LLLETGFGKGDGLGLVLDPFSESLALSAFHRYLVLVSRLFLEDLFLQFSQHG
jgi:hypothetical protein